jgi:hypothetical protein
MFVMACKYEMFRDTLGDIGYNYSKINQFTSYLDVNYGFTLNISLSGTFHVQGVVVNDEMKFNWFLLKYL